MNIVDFDYFLDREPAVRVQGRPRRGLEIDGEHWFLRFPKDKSSNKDVLAEYIGSHIYGILGDPVNNVGGSGDQVQVVFPFQSLLNDLHVQQS